MTGPAYVVTVTRDANLWAAQIDGLPPGCVGATDVEHFADLDVDVRDLVAGLTDVAPDAFDLDWHYVQNDHDYTAALDHAREWQRRLSEAEENRDRQRTIAAREMARAGLSQRAIGDALGISHQRVGQILAVPADTPERLGRVG